MGTISKKWGVINMRFSFGKTPERIIFFATNRCNSKCSHCFYWKNINNKTDELSLNEISKIAGSLGSFYELFISGGEPFLREDIDDIIKIFYEKCNIKQVHIPTNCLLGNKIIEKVKSISARCPNLSVVIGVSLEGLRETNDEIRGVEGHFDKAISLALELKELRRSFPDVQVYFISVVSNKNVLEMFELAKYIQKTTGLALDIAPIRGKPKDSNLLAPNWKLFENLLEDIEGTRPKPRLSFIQGLQHKKSKYTDKIIVEVLKNNKLPIKCLAGKKIGVIEPNGDVKLCELTESVGNLRDYHYDFHKLWANKKAVEMKQKIEGCFCTHGCFISTSLKYSPKIIKCMVGK